MLCLCVLQVMLRVGDLEKSIKFYTEVSLCGEDAGWGGALSEAHAVYKTLNDRGLPCWAAPAGGPAGMGLGWRAERKERLHLRLRPVEASAPCC